MNVCKNRTPTVVASRLPKAPLIRNPPWAFLIETRQLLRMSATGRRAQRPVSLQSAQELPFAGSESLAGQCA
jgi:hypothetical protein